MLGDIDLIFGIWVYNYEYISLRSNHKLQINFEIRSGWMILWKKGNNFKMGNQIYFKIAGYVDLDMLNIFAV
jgi:hypothetical protein